MFWEGKHTLPIMLDNLRDRFAALSLSTQYNYNLAVRTVTHSLNQILAPRLLRLCNTSATFPAIIASSALPTTTVLRGRDGGLLRCSSSSQAARISTRSSSLSDAINASAMSLTSAFSSAASLPSHFNARAARLVSSSRESRDVSPLGPARLASSSTVVYGKVCSVAGVGAMCITVGV